MDSFWSVLELEPTQDVSAIKRAYAGKARECHPEEDPEGFQRLHEAYQQARKLAENRVRRSGSRIGPQREPGRWRRPGNRRGREAGPWRRSRRTAPTPLEMARPPGSFWSCTLANGAAIPSGGWTASPPPPSGMRPERRGSPISCCSISTG